MDVPVEVLGVYLDPGTNSSVVLLGEVNESTRVLPIHIGAAEAQSIAIGLQHIETPRPLTHDLMVEIMSLLGISLESITVTALKEGTFLAEIEIVSSSGVAVLSARPSDAIALAVRLGTQIHVVSAVLDEAGVEVRHEQSKSFSDEEVEEIMDEFREFLSMADSSDFAEGEADQGEADQGEADQGETDLDHGDEGR